MSDRSEVATASAHVAGESVELHSSGALYWPERRTLLVADAHFGKAAAFRAAGVFVPEQTTTESLARLDRSIDCSRAQRIIFLGDFLHAAKGRHPATLRSLGEWRERHSAIEMVLVRGNHDRKAGDPPASLCIRCVDAPLLEPPFAFAHHPVAVDDAYVLAGHIHPGALMVGAGRQYDHFPCFWFGANVGVLPAFGEFTGYVDVEPMPGDQVWIVANDQVIPVGRRERGPATSPSAAPARLREDRDATPGP